MEKKYHTQWRDEDVAGIIPELAPLLADPTHIDFDALRTQMDSYIGDSMDRLQQAAHGEAAQKFLSSGDPHALADMLADMDDVMVNIKRLMTFAQAAPHHYAADDKEKQKKLEQATEKLTSIAGFLEQTVMESLAPIRGIDDQSLNALIAQEPRLKSFRPLIERATGAPTPDAAKVGLLNSDAYIKAIDTFMASQDSSLEAQERDRLFAEGLSGIIHFKQEQTQALGFASTRALSAYVNKAPRDMMDATEKAGGEHTATAIKSFMGLQELVENKLAGDHKKYSFDEAKDIVCDAYGSVDPSLGAIARRAFDEGWLRIAQNMETNPHTLGGVPQIQQQDAHPFAITHFNGNPIDVIFMGHEMAHVISNYIAGQHNSTFAMDASMLVQESFSHFGEALVEKEMMRRAGTDNEKLTVELAFAAKEADALSVLQIAKLEGDMYDLVKRKGGNASHQDFSDLLKNSPLAEDISNIRHMPTLWNIVMQQPHNMTVYPVSKIMSAAMFEAFEKSPQAFAHDYIDIMKKGGHVSASEVWDKLTGLGRDEQKAYIDKRVASVEPRLEALKLELGKLPDVPKKDTAGRAPDVAPGADVHASPGGDNIAGVATGHFTSRVGGRPQRKLPAPKLSQANWVDGIDSGEGKGTQAFRQ